MFEVAKSQSRNMTDAEVESTVSKYLNK